jgi:hypothetical protein
MNKKTKAFYGRKIAAMIAEGSGYTPEAHAVVRLAESLTRLPSDDIYFLDLLMALKNGTYTSTTAPEESKSGLDLKVVEAMLPPISEILAVNALEED